MKSRILIFVLLFLMGLALVFAFVKIRDLTIELDGLYPTSNSTSDAETNSPAESSHSGNPNDQPG